LKKFLEQKCIRKPIDEKRFADLVGLTDQRNETPPDFKEEDQ